MRRLQPADWVRYTTSPVLRSLAVTSCGWLLSLGALAMVRFPLRAAPLPRRCDNIGFRLGRHLADHQQHRATTMLCGQCRQVGEAAGTDELVGRSEEHTSELQ